VDGCRGVDVQVQVLPLGVAKEFRDYHEDEEWLKEWLIPEKQLLFLKHLQLKGQQILSGR